MGSPKGLIHRKMGLFYGYFWLFLFKLIQTLFWVFTKVFMRRTTSMSEITFDLNTATEDDPLNRQGQGQGGVGGPSPWSPAGFNNGLDQSRVLAMVSPRNHRRHSAADLAHTPDFLRLCFLCKRRLAPGRDIYMYRGDSAFCSLECRQQQMNQDEKKDKSCVASKKQVVVPSSGSQVTTKGETVVATKS